MRPEQDAAAWMRDRLRNGLTQAMKNREPDTVGALRSAIAAIDNAQAPGVAPDGEADRNSEHVAGARHGVGSTEVERRQLSAADVHRLLDEQVADYQRGAEAYERAGWTAEAARLRRQADVLARYAGHPD